jgi:hypothetical protein
MLMIRGGRVVDCVDRVHSNFHQDLQGKNTHLSDSGRQDLYTPL